MLHLLLLLLPNDNTEYILSIYSRCELTTLLRDCQIVKMFERKKSHAYIIRSQLSGEEEKEAREDRKCNTSGYVMPRLLHVSPAVTG